MKKIILNICLFIVSKLKNTKPVMFNYAVRYEDGAIDISLYQTIAKLKRSMNMIFDGSNISIEKNSMWHHGVPKEIIILEEINQIPYKAEKLK